MPLRLRRGVVSAVVEEADGLIRLEVDGIACVAYPGLTGPVQVGDEVLVNEQARELGLGSGGFDILHANLTRGLGLEDGREAHVMVLPYTPVQHAVRHVEEDGPLADDLGGLPVVCCTLHSQVAPACAALAGHRVVYVQIPGGALPVALSDTVRALKARGLVEQAAGVGPCFGGDAQAVSTSSALGWAAGAGFDAAVCAVGPGIVGTGSRFGHGGLNAAHAANAAAMRGGAPVVAVRVSYGDPRARHQGVSHHTRAVLELCGERVRAAWPAGLEVADDVGPVEVVDVEGWREACAGLPLEHMGRGPDDDPWFFASAFAAGRLADRLVR
jgi:Protein of unknown function (DUF3866)